MSSCCSGPGCGGAKHVGLQNWRSVALPSVLFPLTRNFTPHCLFPPGSINGYQGHTAGGNPAMDYWQPNQGGVAILLVASCYRDWDKLRPRGPPWLVSGLTLLLLYLLMYTNIFVSIFCSQWYKRLLSTYVWIFPSVKGTLKTLKKIKFHFVSL